MKTRILACFLLVVSISFFIACGPSEVDLNGDVFIVTQGGSSIKLGLVEIDAIAEPDMSNFIKSKMEHAKIEMDRLKPVLVNLLSEVKQTHDVYDKVWHAQADNPDNEKINKEFALTYQRFDKKREEYNSFEAQYFGFLKGTYWLEGLPRPIQVTKSDADGKFTLKLKPGRYGLVATSVRKVINSTEEYYWILWMDVNKKSLTKVLLSNDNLLERKSANCAVPFNLLPGPLTPLAELLLTW